MNKLEPVHPGEILLEEFMIPLKLSQNKLGKSLKVSPRRINEIVNGKRQITADTALRLAKFFGNSAQFWVNLQSRYDLIITGEQLSGTLEQIESLNRSA